MTGEIYRPRSFPMSLLDPIIMAEENDPFTDASDATSDGEAYDGSEISDGLLQAGVANDMKLIWQIDWREISRQSYSFWLQSSFYDYSYDDDDHDHEC